MIQVLRSTKRNGKAESGTSFASTITGDALGDEGSQTVLAAPPDTKRLIVNADDFGRTEAVNKGVVQAHEKGIVTSASLMVRWPAAEEAARIAAQQESLGLGIHIDLGEWCKVGEAWEVVYEIVPLSDRDAVAAEVANQLGRFHKLLGRSPTHIDSHQHVHRSEPVAAVLSDFGRRLRIPVRGTSPKIRYCGDFYGQSHDGSPYPEGITVDSLLAIMETLEPGVTELSCHPGLETDPDSTYGEERVVELRALCDPRLRHALALHEISLTSYRTLDVT